MSSSSPAPTPSTWWKSSYSESDTVACVETAYTPDGMAVRDTQNRPLGHLEFSAQEWRAFLTGLEGL